MGSLDIAILGSLDRLKLLINKDVTDWDNIDTNLGNGSLYLAYNSVLDEVRLYGAKNDYCWSVELLKGPAVTRGVS